MEHWRRNGQFLWAGVFLTSASLSLIMPFLPIFIKEMGVTTGVEGWSGAAFAITYLAAALMAPVWGNLADRYGSKIMVVRSALTIAIIYYLMSLTHHLAVLLALRFLNGLFTGYMPAAMALMATNTPREHAGRALAGLSAATATGTVLGPLIGGALADAIGIRQAMVVGSGLMLVAAMLAGFGVRETVRTRAAARTSVSADLRTAMHDRLLLVLLVALVVGQSSVLAVEPVLTLHIQALRQEGWLTALTRWLLPGHGGAVNLVSGFIFSLPAVAQILVAGAWARRGERTGYGGVLVLGLGLGGLFVLPQALAATAMQIAVLRFTFGLCQASVQPAVSAILAREIPVEFRGRAFGITQSATFVGAVIGPMVGGGLATALGTRAVFAVTGLLLLLAALWLRRRLPNASGGTVQVYVPTVAGEPASNGKGVRPVAGRQ